MHSEQLQCTGGGTYRVLPLSAALSHAVLSDTIKRTFSSDYTRLIMHDGKDRLVSLRLRQKPVATG